MSFNIRQLGTVSLLAGVLFTNSSLVFARGGHGGAIGHGHSSPSAVFVNGHFRNGTWVAPHMRSHPDGNFYNNWSTVGNVNPYTGVPGTRVTPPSRYPSSGSVFKASGGSYLPPSPITTYTSSISPSTGSAPSVQLSAPTKTMAADVLQTPGAAPIQNIPAQSSPKISTHVPLPSADPDSEIPSETAQPNQVFTPKATVRGRAALHPMQWVVILLVSSGILLAGTVLFVTWRKADNAPREMSLSSTIATLLAELTAQNDRFWRRQG